MKQEQLLTFLVTVLIFLVSSQFGIAKIYDRCDLARELRDLHEIPEEQVATWVCIARHESEYNTSAINPASGDHGLFQISQLFWCSSPGYACGVSCEDLRNDDIEDDVICARRIYREHKRISGDGFNAWVVYGQYCRDKNYAQTFLDGCTFAELKSLQNNQISTKPLPTINYYPQFTRKSTTSTTTAKTVLITPKPIYTSSWATSKSSTSQETTFKMRKTTSLITTTKKHLSLTNVVSSVGKTTHGITSHVTTPRITSHFSPSKPSSPRIIASTKPISTIGTTVSSKRFEQLKPTEQNEEFTFAISKTGYKFTRF